MIDELDYSTDVVLKKHEDFVSLDENKMTKYILKPTSEVNLNFVRTNKSLELDYFACLKHGFSINIDVSVVKMFLYGAYADHRV